MVITKNDFETFGEYTAIYLKNGLFTVISTESLELVIPYTWCMEGTGYVMSRTGGKAVKLHRIITEAQKGDYVDHIDRNPLNNTLGNLRCEAANCQRS